MAERDLINAFDDCIERLNDGEALDTCLRAYPQFAAELRPMLMAGQVVRRARIDALEVQAAQARGRERLRFAMQENPPIPQRRANTVPFMRLLTQAAAIILILGVFLGGTALAAESSLPGDPLYGYKRLTENVRLTLPGDREALAEQFAQRRVDEIRQLLAINRAESVDFSGVVESMAAAQWQVAGLLLSVPSGTPDTASIRVNDYVAVQAFTSADGTLTAEHIRLIEPGEQPPLPTATDLPTQMPTETLMPTMTPTVAPTSTQPPLPSATTMPPPTQTPPAPTSTQPAPTQASGSSAVCIPTPLPNWVEYSIRSGDTLSGLATQTGISLDQLMAVNCLSDARFIVAWQRIWLPVAPSSSQSSGSSGSGSSSGSSSSGSGDDASGDDDDNSDSSNSGSGSNDDDDDGGSSGSGGGDDDDD